MVCAALCRFCMAVDGSIHFSVIRYERIGDFDSIQIDGCVYMGKNYFRCRLIAGPR